MNSNEQQDQTDQTDYPMSRPRFYAGLPFVKMGTRAIEFVVDRCGQDRRMTPVESRLFVGGMKVAMTGERIWGIR